MRVRPRNELTRDQAAALGILKPVVQAKRSKYGNVKVVLDGVTFDSKAEAEHYRSLRILMNAGKVREIARQYAIDLTDPRTPKIKEVYKADFLVSLSDGSVEVHEVKGFWTRDAKRKWKKAQALYPQFRFVVIGQQMKKGKV